MSKPENILKYYVLCNKLKNTIRTGWKDWHVKRERIESVAEHVYGVQMLALAMYSEYKYDIDIHKVILMLAIHELEEIIIGDLTMFDIDKETKTKMGHDAVKKVLSSLKIKEDLEKIVNEFDERKTKEAIFAFHCDKLECDIQCKLYDQEHCVDLSDQEGNISYGDPTVQELLKTGKSWSEMWLEFGQGRYNYDKNFLEVSNYLKDNEI